MSRPRSPHPSRSRRLDDAPYLTHVVRHHGKITLVPPETAGRTRRPKQIKIRPRLERAVRSSDSEEPELQNAPTAMHVSPPRSLTPRSRPQSPGPRVRRVPAGRESFNRRPERDAEEVTIPDVPPPSFLEAISTPPFNPRNFSASSSSIRSISPLPPSNILSSRAPPIIPSQASTCTSVSGVSSTSRSNNTSRSERSIRESMTPDLPQTQWEEDRKLGLSLDARVQRERLRRETADHAPLRSSADTSSLTSPSSGGPFTALLATVQNDQRSKPVRAHTDPIPNQRLGPLIPRNKLERVPSEPSLSKTRPPLHRSKTLDDIFTPPPDPSIRAVDQVSYKGKERAVPPDEALDTWEIVDTPSKQMRSGVAEGKSESSTLEPRVKAVTANRSTPPKVVFCTPERPSPESWSSGRPHPPMLQSRGSESTVSPSPASSAPQQPSGILSSAIRPANAAITHPGIPVSVCSMCERPIPPPPVPAFLTRPLRRQTPPRPSVFPNEKDPGSFDFREATIHSSSTHSGVNYHSTDDPPSDIYLNAARSEATYSCSEISHPHAAQNTSVSLDSVRQDHSFSSRSISPLPSRSSSSKHSSLSSIFPPLPPIMEASPEQQMLCSLPASPVDGTLSPHIVVSSQTQEHNSPDAGTRPERRSEWPEILPLPPSPVLPTRVLTPTSVPLGQDSSETGSSFDISVSSSIMDPPEVRWSSAPQESTVHRYEETETLRVPVQAASIASSESTEYSTYTDLDLLVSRLEDPDASSGTDYEALVLISDILGPVRRVTPPSDATFDELVLSGSVEVQRRRVTKDGRIKLKLSVLGLAVDRCGICLNQFRKEEKAGLLGCRHVFHAQCLKRWLIRSRTCPFCRVPLEAQAT